MTTDDKVPMVTVVMPVYNEERFVGATLRQLVQQEYPPERMEILVVDGLSQDRTRDIVLTMAKKHPNIKLVDNPKRRSGAGRNIGFKAGCGDYFVVIDGHCYLPSNQLIKNIVTNFENSGAHCLGRPQTLDPPGLSFFQKAVALARASRIGHGGDSFIYRDFEGFISPVSSGAAYRREVFSTVGYVDEEFDAAEDVEFNYRLEQAGLTCFTAPSLKVKYYPRSSFNSLFHQLARYGRGRVRFIRKHPEAFTFNQLIPFLFVIGLIFLIPSSLFWVMAGKSVVWPLLLHGPYIFYLVAICFMSLLLALKNEWRNLFVLPLIFFVIHFSLGWGFFMGIFGRQMRRAERDIQHA